MEIHFRNRKKKGEFCEFDVGLKRFSFFCSAAHGGEEGGGSKVIKLNFIGSVGMCFFRLFFSNSVAPGLFPSFPPPEREFRECVVVAAWVARMATKELFALWNL